MANKKKSLLMIRKIIRLKQQNRSIHQITRILGISRNTVRGYLRGLSRSGYSLESVLELDDKALSELFCGAEKQEDERYLQLEEQFSYLEKELLRTGVTRWLLWQEYKMKHPQGYGYTQFCYHFRQWRKQKDVVMHFEHKAGDKLFIDFTGQKLTIVDKETGAKKQVEVFIAILGCSQLTYVEAVLSQQLADFIGATARVLAYIGGVTRALVPDNLKAAVHEASNYEALLNRTYEDLADYYNTVILPTRSRKPRDKAHVEKAVSIIYSRIFAKLRNRVFYSLEALNQAIWSLLDEHNRTPFQGETYSRRDLFEELEKPVLSPLPAETYQIRYFSRATAGRNYYVLLKEDKHYYSVPFRYARRRLELIYTRQNVEIYYKHERIACHKRDYRPGKHTTNLDHLPPSHRFVAEWSEEKFINWAAELGEDILRYIEQVLAQGRHPEQAYKSCLGILELASKVGTERLGQACRRAHYYQSYGYQVVRNILDKGLEKVQPQVEQPDLPCLEHENIRGGQYYQ